LANFCAPLSSNRQHYHTDVWRITGKIIRTTIMLITMHAYNGVLNFYSVGFGLFCVSVKIKLTIPLLCVCIPSGKAVAEMI